MIKFLNKLTKIGATALVAGTSLFLTSLPASANNTQVYVINSSCMSYDPYTGEAVGTLQNDYYYLDEIYEGEDGRNYAAVRADFSSIGLGSNIQVGIPTSCVDNDGTYVIEY